MVDGFLVHFNAHWCPFGTTLEATYPKSAQKVSPKGCRERSSNKHQNKCEFGLPRTLRIERLCTPEFHSHNFTITPKSNQKGCRSHSIWAPFGTFALPGSICAQVLTKQGIRKTFKECHLQIMKIATTWTQNGWQFHAQWSF